MSASFTLPDELSYLQPAVDRLAALPGGELNEDVDTSFIDQCVLARFAGCDPIEAEETFESHYETIKSLRRESDFGPLHFLQGYLGIYLFEPDALTNAPEPARASSRVEVADVELTGFTEERAEDVQLVLRRGELCITITAIDELSMSVMLAQQQKWRVPTETQHKHDRRVEAVQFGEVRGMRELFERTPELAFKQANYLLSVPGGQVQVSAFAQCGENYGGDFHVADVETVLPTIRVVPVG